MADVRFEPEKLQEAVTVLLEAANGSLIAPLQDIYQTIKECGNDDNITEATQQKFHALEQEWNDKSVPAINKAIDGLNAHTELSKYLLGLDVNRKVGSIEGNAGKIGAAVEGANAILGNL